MAENNVEPEHEWSDRALDTAEDTLVAMENLLATLKAFEDVLRQQEISIASSTEYCDNFCQALMHYAGSRNSMEHGLPLLEVYCLSINCFAAARSHLTAESDRVALVLKRLALSCFELLLSVPENEIPYEAWVQFHHSVQVGRPVKTLIAHDTLLQYGSTDLQALLQITGEGGAWSNPVLSTLLTGQVTNPEEVDAYISLEGEGFMEMRVKHLEKMGEVAKAVVLAKACTECSFISNQATFRQTYVSLLCHLLPSEEAIMEISRLDCKDVLEITCSLETEGEENTAFILCTTFLTQQLQQQSLYCSWELTLLWSKLQRRIDSSLQSLLDRCLQLGAIAKTVHHLLYLVRVIQTEVEGLGGVPASVELCVKALQLPKQDDSETRISVCKTVSCLLPDDLEVLRACLLTEFLLGPSQEVFGCLEELYLRPDQKYDQENEVIPNSLRCELLLALKAYWPFDPEFWDWKTLKYHCISLLGLMPESEGEEEEVVDKQEKLKQHEPHGVTVKVESEHQTRTNGSLDGYEQQSSNLPEIKGEYRTKKHKFCCQICKRSVTDSQIIHHSKRHAVDNINPCPVCLEKFKSRKELVPHVKQHIQCETDLSKNIKKEDLQKLMEDDDEIEPGEITIDPSLMLYYKSTHDPDVLHHIVQQAKTVKEKRVDDDEHVTFEYIDQHFKVQNRDEYPCPGTGCARIFKHSKYFLHRHYLRVHRMRREDLFKNEVKLVFNAEQLEELIQRKSARPTVAGASAPNGVRKMEYQADPENTGGQPAPMSLLSIKADPQGEDNQDPLEFPEEEEEGPPPVERNGVLVDADEVLYGEPSTGGHSEDATAATQTSQKQEERLSLDKIKPLLRPVTVDLSTPCSLRFTAEESFQDASTNKDGGKMLNGSVALPSPPVRQPLKRKNELSEQPSNMKDPQPRSPSPRPFDIAAYKPMGFESSFLKFIQETTPKDKNAMPLKRRDSFKRSCSVKENNQLGISHTRSRRTHSPLLKPHAMTGDFTSVQNLKSILDKALAGCGDLAIKQLQYLRPVVVLGRPVCTTTLPDLFPSDTNSKLLLGS
ncbi:Zinc finger protein Rlf Rearranged L-myc fusion gene protein Zn-15-related protein [Channa argus]|uniref:Zinc finger protein Rlf Rearranged L-myc fusion gene protein Zn-15-related protein n=1 Tax=Channa argus TaxID=215402 RepID=A0A6G1QFX3_CHAAH|nr:Zinc finger protein Rlf Rearranged L-myc fusion gene protein Zn-15-related protein [Channa argus]